mmetsp:Transcript_52823/g.128064  ORF Transcript_52823/g.128064 Transcript_52823/m.128064 type:complete len:444 (+) Transcript_52823:589-1920(+)
MSSTNIRQHQYIDADPAFILETSSYADAASASAAGSQTQNVVRIPRLAFGLYKVPNNAEGERIVVDAIQAGYRHFDSASAYGNEGAVGRAIKQCCRPSSTDASTIVSRSELYISSKVWNDAQVQGREAVRQSILKSLQDLQLEYLDCVYVHWPVPGRYIETYQELQQLVDEGKIRAIGISNFTIQEFENLMAAPDIKILPEIHQFEVSPFMYRPHVVQFFQQLGIIVAASKALHRGVGINDPEADSSIVDMIASDLEVTSAQIMLRWSFQKNLVVLCKTSNPARMRENRDILSFDLTTKEMELLDGLTSAEEIDARAKLEEERKRGGAGDNSNSTSHPNNDGSVGSEAKDGSAKTTIPIPAVFPASIEELCRFIDAHVHPGFLEKQQDNRQGCSRTRGKLRKFANKFPTHKGTKHWIETKSWKPPTSEAFVALVLLTLELYKK